MARLQGLIFIPARPGHPVGEGGSADRRCHSPAQEIARRDAGAFTPAPNDQVRILRPTDPDSIKYYASVENHTNTTRARDFIHMNSDQFMNECIQQGERFWALFQELTTNLTAGNDAQARLNRLQDLNANQMYELLEKLDGQGVASVLS